MPHAPETGAIK